MPIYDKLKDESEHQRVLNYMNSNIISITTGRRPIEMAVILALSIFEKFNHEIFEELVKVYKAPDNEAAIFYFRELWNTLDKLLDTGNIPPKSVLNGATREELVLILSKETLKKFEMEAIKLIDAIQNEPDQEQAQYYLALSCIRCMIEPENLKTVITYLK